MSQAHFLEKVFPLLLEDFVIQGPQGHTYLNEGEEQAHGEVGEPVDTASHHEGRRPGGLQEDLGDEQRRDGALGKEGQLYSLEAEQAHQGCWSPCCVQEPGQEQCVSRTPGPVQKQHEKAKGKSSA